MFPHMPAPAVDPVFLHLQALVAGRFSLERELGRGGMGIVYLARDVALERPVAIKVLAPSLAARHDMRQRFLREARIAAQCFHPHIVPIHAVEEADELAWIVMAYVRGETLADRLRRTGPLDAEELRRLGREVGWALAYAHQRGVVHRDIKPENLLIDASTGRYVIADFGIAQHANQVHTPANGSAASGATGTARYMAPEQALGEPLDGRADLYALGVTLFVAATGRAPFEGSNAMALVAQHTTQPAPSVKSLAPTLPLPLVRAIDRCLAKRPADRFPDAERFLEAIEPDVREASLSPALLAVQRHAAAARAMLGWSAVSSLSTLLLIAGEPAQSFGRAIFSSMGFSMAGLFAFAASVRAAEALLDTRRQLRRGQNPRDLVVALTGSEPVEIRETDGSTRRWQRGTLLAVAGAALAYAQGVLTRIHVPDTFMQLPSTDWLTGALQIGSVFLPPMMMARGADIALTSTGLGRWIRERVTAPLCARAVRFLGQRTAGAAPVAFPDDAPTEVLLVRAVEAAIVALPAAHRKTVGDADQVARALAREATRLRERAQHVDAQEAAALVLRDADAREAALLAVRAEREETRSRMQTTVAALESLRLDIMRLASDRTEGGLTDVLKELQDVQYRVDAAIDVRRLVRDATPV